MRRAFDWVTAWIILFIAGMCVVAVAGVAFEVIKFLALLKYLFS